MNKKLFFINVMLMCASIILCMGALELILRLGVYQAEQKSLGKVLKKLPIVQDGEVVTLGQIIQPSRFEKIIYELRRNLRVNYIGQNFETNAQGWRGPEYSEQKKKDVVRIIGLGDSFMIGYGIFQEKTYLQLLENRLNREYPQKKWEVINTSVPGYNAYMEAETLERRALAYRPDIVIIENIGNDKQLANFILRKNQYIDPHRVFLFELLKHRMVLASRSFELTDAPLDEEECRSVGWGYSSDPSKVPPLYADMVGDAGLKRAMEKLKKLQEENKFDLIVIHTRTCADNNFLQMCDNLKIPVIINCMDKTDPSLFFSNKDGHPSQKGHEVTYERIYSYLEKERFIERYVNK